VISLSDFAVRIKLALSNVLECSHFVLGEIMKDWCHSSSTFDSSLVKPYGHGVFFTGSILITGSISFLVIGLFRFSIYS
jgi:hypothetical protein